MDTPGTRIRKILHLDLDAFFCAVEELHNPALVGKPFAVGGRPDERGVVASCSYAARQMGVRSAMPMGRAMRLCPQLIVIPGRHGQYSAVSDQVMAILHDVTPLMEQISIDEAFLDVTDLPQSSREIAEGLQRRIREELKLPCSIGGASNKLVAKIATDFGKGRHRGPTPPRAIHIVPPGEEAAFLAPLPVQALLGVGPKTAERLNQLGVHTVGDLAAMPEPSLRAQFGRFGADLARSARGMDDSPIHLEHEVKSISQEVTFSRDVAGGPELERTLRSLSDQVGYRLRAADLCASVVRIKIRWPDFSTHTRQQSLPQPVDQDGVIYAEALRLFHAVWAPGRAVRLLGVGVSGLAGRARQLELWETPNEKEHRLLEALDELRERFGKTAVVRAERLRPPRKKSE